MNTMNEKENLHEYLYGLFIVVTDHSSLSVVTLCFRSKKNVNCTINGEIEKHSHWNYILVDTIDGKSIICFAIKIYTYKLRNDISNNMEYVLF